MYTNAKQANGRERRRRKRRDTERTIYVRLQLRVAIELAHTCVCSERFNGYFASIAFYSCMYSHLVLVCENWNSVFGVPKTHLFVLARHYDACVGAQHTRVWSVDATNIELRRREPTLNRPYRNEPVSFGWLALYSPRV